MVFIETIMDIQKLHKFSSLFKFMKGIVYYSIAHHEIKPAKYIFLFLPYL
jgi:hypothetical protein